jgi:hypothetical protein
LALDAQRTNKEFDKILRKMRAEMPELQEEEFKEIRTSKSPKKKIKPPQIEKQESFEWSDSGSEEKKKLEKAAKKSQNDKIQKAIENSMFVNLNYGKLSVEEALSKDIGHEIVYGFGPDRKPRAVTDLKTEARMRVMARAMQALEWKKQDAKPGTIRRKDLEKDLLVLDAAVTQEANIATGANNIQTMEDVIKKNKPKSQSSEPPATLNPSGYTDVYSKLDKQRKGLLMDVYDMTDEIVMATEKKKPSSEKIIEKPIVTQKTRPSDPKKVGNYIDSGDSCLEDQIMPIVEKKTISIVEKKTVIIVDTIGGLKRRRDQVERDIRAQGQLMRMARIAGSIISVTGYENSIAQLEKDLVKIREEVDAEIEKSRAQGFEIAMANSEVGKGLKSILKRRAYPDEKIKKDEGIQKDSEPKSIKKSKSVVDAPKLAIKKRITKKISGEIATSPVKPRSDSIGEDSGFVGKPRRDKNKKAVFFDGLADDAGEQKQIPNM